MRPMPYRVTVAARFEAAHNLIDYEGGPEPLHGHSYRVEAMLESEKLQRYDVAVDFVPAKKALGCADCHEASAITCTRCHQKAQQMDLPEHRRKVYPEVKAFIERFDGETLAGPKTTRRRR